MVLDNKIFKVFISKINFRLRDLDMQRIKIIRTIIKDGHMRIGLVKLVKIQPVV